MVVQKQFVILIVEDNPTGIASLVGILAPVYELVIAKTLAEAKQYLSTDVDVVLLDLYLPDGKGIDFLVHLRGQRQYEQVPVICISASDQIGDIEEVFREGAIDYVLKPFNKTILSAKVSTFVDLKRKTDLLATQALRDPLTGIGNRRLFDQQLELEWRRAGRQELSIGVVLIDLDHFKAINDTFGHSMGDACLQQLGNVLEATFSRAGDVVARLGGDEFAAILPGANLENTVLAALRLKNALVETSVDEGAEGCPAFTVSIGCYAMVPERNTPLSALLDRADQHLYEAKDEGGRDCVRPVL